MLELGAFALKSDGAWNLELLQLQEFQSRQVLRIHNAHRYFVVIHYDKIVDTVAFKQIKNFDRKPVFVHSHRVERHQVGHEALPDFGIGLKMSGKIAVRKNTE